MRVVAARADDVGTVEWLRTHGVRILAVVAIALAMSKGASIAVRRMRRRLDAAQGLTREHTIQRTATLTHALSNVAQVVIWTLAVLLILDQLGVNLAPLIAGAGIAGVAVGFGAQSLVRDFFAGFFILLEDQLGVGDVVDVYATGGNVSGTVETLTLRTTSVRGVDGTRHVIPNGNIQLIGNKSRGEPPAPGSGQPAA